MVRRLPVKETIAGSIPASAVSQRKGKPMGDGSRLESGRAMSLEGSTPSPSARGSANGRPPGFEPDDEGSTPSPRTLDRWISSSWSSLECSPPCHGGGHGFKSHRGRSTARYANRQSGQAQTLVIDCGFNSHPCYWKCVGWALASLSGCNPPAETLCRFNSCPTH
jgi:hypothetical protein